MSQQSNQLGGNSCHNQSVFGIIASGADPSAVRSSKSSSGNQRRKKVFDSADYFTRQQQLEEKEKRRKEQEVLMQQQSRDSFEKACQSMSEKYGVSNFQRKLSLIQKQKKKFDSADYFMEKIGVAEEDVLPESDDQDAGNLAMKHQSDLGEKHFICCPKRNPLLQGKQRKAFDSADYFMKEHGSSHPMSLEEWKDLLEKEIAKIEQDYRKSTSEDSHQQELTLNPANYGSPETDKMVKIQSEKMESQYILNKKRIPLINKHKQSLQFDSADYFMQQSEQQHQHQFEDNRIEASIGNEAEGVVGIQAELCERIFILQKKNVAVQVAANQNKKKKKEFDSADYFMEKAAANSDNSISDD